MERQLTDELIFKKSNTRVGFIAEKAIRDSRGQIIDKTYATITELMRHLAEIEGEKKAAELSANDATNEAERARYSADSIAKVIRKCAENVGADIDTILAASDVADKTASNGRDIANADYYRAVTNNAAADKINDNSACLVEYINALRDLVVLLVNHCVLYDLADGIRIPQSIEKYITLQKVSKVTTVTDGGDVPTRWAFPINLKEH